jgi:hydrogenase maturation factor HypF (carbamoyltransferase family)
MSSAYSIRIRGVVQGVGFRPFVFRLARANTLAGWVLNGEDGVELFVEGAAAGLQAFVQILRIEAVFQLCEIHRVDTVVLSGGVFQNELLLEDLKIALSASPLVVWTNHQVPPNEGGISLGQAALACFGEAQ